MRYIINNSVVLYGERQILKYCVFTGEEAKNSRYAAMMMQGCLDCCIYTKTIKEIEPHMNIDTKTLISISQANQNFSKVARLVDRYGAAVILKNNVPRCVITEFNKAENIAEPNREMSAALTDRLSEPNSQSFDELVDN